MKLQKIYYEPLPYQEIFHNSTKNKVLLSSGYGGGKTFSLCMKLFRLCHENWALPGGLLCPTLKQFKRDVMPTIEQICNNNGIGYSFHKTDFYYVFYPTRSRIYIFHGEDDGKSIKGPNLAFMLINEVTLCSKGAFDAAISRIRLKQAMRRQVAMSGTPELSNWVYDYFIENPREDTDVIYGDMRLNTHIASDYAQMLIESYDKQLVEQYVEGKFVNLTGNRAIYAFDRQIHIKKDVEKIPNAPVWIAIDFNVDPMSATLMNRMGPNDNYWLQIFDEVCISGSNTYELVKVIKEKLSLDDIPFVYPDPAGKARSTRTRGKTDIDILAEGLYQSKEDAVEYIKYKRSIQSVRDCLNALNNLFDKRKIVISSKCKNVIADLERCVIKQGTFEIDKSDPKRSHWLDGLKNMADYEFPVRAKLQHWSKQIR